MVTNRKRNSSNETSDMNVLNEVFMIVRWNQRKCGYKGNCVQMAGDKMYEYAEKLNDTKEQNRW
jgi:hypothetical protein